MRARGVPRSDGRSFKRADWDDEGLCFELIAIADQTLETDPGPRIWRRTEKLIARDAVGPKRPFQVGAGRVLGQKALSQPMWPINMSADT
jgi:hypothetical protein